MPLFGHVQIPGAPLSTQWGDHLWLPLGLPIEFQNPSQGSRERCKERHFGGVKQPGRSGHPS